MGGGLYFWLHNNSYTLFLRLSSLLFDTFEYSFCLLQSNSCIELCHRVSRESGWRRSASSPLPLCGSISVIHKCVYMISMFNLMEIFATISADWIRKSVENK